jgi:myo-inositol 2-dehydrogenase/D-chiro-inositol 1-dehydrogenase
VIDPTSQPIDFKVVKKRRLAIIGFGRLAQKYYVPALRSIGMAEIVAVADPLAASRAAAEAVFPQAHTYPTYHELLEHSTLDGILVASPPSTHLAVWNEAARRGVPAFMEKPFVLWGELDGIERSSKACQLLMPNFNRRFWPSYQVLRELCLSRRIGTVERADFVLRVNLRPWNSVTRHRLSPGEGGALYDLGSSQLDLIQYVLGERIVTLQAQIESLRSPNDQVHLTAELEGRLRVSCELGYAERNCESVAIVGNRASVWLSNPNARVHLRERGSRSSWSEWLGDALTIGYRAARRERSMLRYTVRASLAEFLRALSRGQRFSPNLDDAIENATCLEAAMRSAREAKSIEVRRKESVTHVCHEPA